MICDLRESDSEDSVVGFLIEMEKKNNVEA